MSIRTTFDVTIVVGERKVVRVSANNEREALEVALQVHPNCVPIVANWVDDDRDYKCESREGTNT